MLDPLKLVSIATVCLTGASGWLVALRAEPFPSAHQSHQPAAVSGQVRPQELLGELENLQATIEARAVKVSLQEAVAQGVANNPSLAEQFAQLQGQEWALIQAQRKWNPTFQIQGSNPFVGYNWTTYVQDNYAQVRPYQGSKWKKIKSNVPQKYQSKQAQQQQQFQVGVTAQLKWTFIDPTRQPGINSAQSSLEQQRLLFDNAARQLILSLQQSYFQIQNTKQLIDSFKQIFDINKQQLDMLEARKAIGMVTVAEVEQQRSSLYIQLTQLVQYMQNYIASTAQLAQFMALPEDALAVPSEPASPQGLWDRTLGDTLQRSLQYREEILAYSAQAESYRWTGIANMKAYLPVFSLVGRGGVQGNNGYPQTYLGIDPGRTYNTNRQWTANVGIGFNWQFDGGINAAQAQQNFAQSRNLLALKAKTEDQVVSEVRTAYGQMQTAAIAIKAARRSYQSAELAQAAARARFQVGVGDITSVVQAINQLSQSSQQMADSILKYNTSIAELYRYSATWPVTAKQDVEERVQRLRNPTSP
ncbi:TolC family protein [Synechococcus sp. RS9916]|uniref:TolC family protein n=1 Tax=Synechococcus sp. RS9916 TaxID=221359 RepID=UPI0000E537A3|nr:TolC family protein [Synechococcus sp. RS9916]EAU74738.1 Outer membrane efflux protein [Synechococcus sp. RS9916]